MITENTLRVKLEVAGDGQAKASLLDNAGAMDTLEKSQEAVTEAAGAMVDAQKQATAATEAAGETAEEAAARIRAMVQASRERAEAERAAAEASQRSTQTTASATVGLDRLVQSQNRAMAGATRMVQEEQRAAQAAAQASGVGQQRQELEKLVGQIDPTIAALHRLDVQQQQLKDFRAAGVLGAADYQHFNEVIDASRNRIMAAGEAMHSFSLNNANARRELGYLAKDIATGQWGRLSQSFSTLAVNSNALSLVMSPLGVSILAVTAAVGGFVASLYQAAEADAALQRQIILSGNASGMTADQIKAMAQGYATYATSAGKVLDLEKGLLASGSVNARTFRDATAAAVSFGEATGQSQEQVIRLFDELAKDPVQTLEKINQLYGWITPAVMDHVHALEEQGDKAGAVAEAFRAINTAASDTANAEQAAQTTIDRLIARWKHGASEIGGYYQTLINGASPDQQFVRARQDYEQHVQSTQRNSPLDRLLGQVYSPQELQSEWNNLKAMADRLQAQRDAAGLGAQTTDDNKAGSTANSYYDAHFAKLDKLTQKQNELNALTATYEDMWAHTDSSNPRLKGVQRVVGDDGKVSFFGGNFDRDVANVDQKYADKGAASAARASLQADVDAYRQAQKQIDDIFSNSSRSLEGELRAGLVDEQGYYQQRIKLINDHAAKLDASLAKEADALRQHKGNAAEQIKIEQQIKDVEARRAQVEQDAAAARKEADNDHLTALRKMDELNQRISMELATYQRSRAQSVARDIAGIGHGQDYAQQNQILDQVRAQADARRDELTRAAQKDGTLDSDKYKQGLDDIDQWEKEQVQREAGYWAERKAALGDWTNGARAALEDLKSTSEDVADTVRQGLGGMFSDLEDDAVRWEQGSSVSLKNVEQNFEAMITRMAVHAIEAQAASALLGWLGGGAGGYNSLGGSAADYSSIGSDGSFSGGFNLATAGHAEGGRISGPGTSTSDSILARLSTGENVITARATDYYGQRFMDDVNAMRLPRFAQGGRVGGYSSGAPGSMAPIINIQNNNGSDVQASARQQADGRWIANLIIDTVAGDMASGGKIAKAGQQRFGWQRRGVPVSGG